MFPADEQPPEGAEPREAALHGIAEPILLAPGEHWPAPLGSPAGWTSLGRDAHADAPASQGAPERATIIPTIGYQGLGALFRPSAALATTDANGVERLLSEPDFSHIGAAQMETERKTIAVNDKHPLGVLPFLGEADLVTTVLGRRERAVKEGMLQSS